MKPTLSLLIAMLCYGVSYAQPVKIYLSPKAAGGNPQSTFIDSLKFYPLQTDKKTELGNYSNVIPTNDYFLVQQWSDRSMLVYEKNGRLVHKISYKKLGENADPRYDPSKQQLIFFYENKNYALTENDRIDIKTNFSDKKNRKYYRKYIIDLKDTSFSFKKAAPTAFDILNAYNLKGDYYCTYEIAVNKNYKDTTDYEVKIYKDTKFLKGFFPYNKQKEVRYLYARYAGAVTQESPVPDVFYISRPYVDTIYTLSNNVVAPKYQLILPMENSIPKHFFETPFKNATERENFERNNGWLLRQIHLNYETDRYMLFDIRFFSNYGEYIYDKKLNTAFNLKKIKPDSTTYFLPLLDDYGSKHNNRFYKLLNAEQLKKAYEQNKGKLQELPVALQQSLKDSTHPTPIIVEYTFKTN
ncbi:6-bladed beta-propeller [Niabella insulamsoli]|uniref:6-bladed beta-propeller n=1 Tax=Niabella insulamsoli TaxID=3144874 RepID=UPI0031FE00C4